MKTGKSLFKTRIQIMGKSWSVHFKNSSQYIKVFGEDSRAITLARCRQMHFNCAEAYYKDNVVVHELTHGYLFEMGCSDIPYKSESQREEVFCVLNEMRGADIIKQAKPLTRVLNKLATALRAKAIKKAEEEDDSDD